MKTRITLGAALLALSFGAGCATTTTPAAPASPNGELAWETRELAPGVEIRVNPEASPGAREAAERLQAEYRATYLNAR